MYAVGVATGVVGAGAAGGAGAGAGSEAVGTLTVISVVTFGPGVVVDATGTGA